METRGGAQAGIVNQVTSLADQSAEELLSQQLQRWGQDVLFEESLVVTAQMLKLVNG
jgi:glucose-6-phosphate dehydrogenase assembly protein OpcA